MHPCPHWYRIIFDKAKTHLVPGALRADLLADMAARECLPTTQYTFPAIARVNSYGLDTGGMCYVDEPWVATRIDNLTLEFPCTGVFGFLSQAKRLAKRVFASGRPYYKVHGSVHCMTFNPRQLGLLITRLEALLPEAEQVAHVFFADKKSPIEVLRDAQAKHQGVAPEALGPVEAFGSSSADRFIPRERGEA